MRTWRSGRWLVLMTVLLILSCIMQRSIGAHVISERLAMSVAQAQHLSSAITVNTNSQDDNKKETSFSLSSCELSAKSLLSLSPLTTIEPFFYLLGVVLLLSMSAIYVSRKRSQKKHHHPPLPVRLHLHYCILRN
ncbi:metal resistance protein [Proteus myxofaciens]|nr:metal resistance protein [Proteus myxofaciens]